MVLPPRPCTFRLVLTTHTDQISPRPVERCALSSRLSSGSHPCLLSPSPELSTPRSANISLTTSSPSLIGCHARALSCGGRRLVALPRPGRSLGAGQVADHDADFGTVPKRLLTRLKCPRTPAKAGIVCRSIQGGPVRSNRAPVERVLLA